LGPAERSESVPMTSNGAELTTFLREAGLTLEGDTVDWTPLSGGVSSEIWRVDSGGSCFCVKRALARLRVADHWEAPLNRNLFEWEYLKTVDGVAPGRVPRPLAHDAARNALAMEWLAPEQNRLWKSELLSGRVDPADAAGVGDALGCIHAATSRDVALPKKFATDVNFHALRIEPYLLTMARRHPDIAPRVADVARVTAATKHVLVHGDVSPKNIFIGPNGPIFVDAECAWFGDPSFDLAFCLNHLAIKARVVRGARDLLIESFDRLVANYLRHVDWEPRQAVEARTAALLPMLALARVDGKSPVEYLNSDQRDALRVVSRRAVILEKSSLHDVARVIIED
jgi:aminoglycoside phosphotransferase (APT) family kinase protein